MKKPMFVIALMLMIQFSVSAKIVNGYNSSVLEKELLLDHLKGVLAKNKIKSSKSMLRLNYLQKQKMRMMIDSLEQYIYYHSLTQELLDNFRLISSGLYDDIDNIYNANGNETDVYVKFVPEGVIDVGQNGITLMYQKPNKKNIPFSAYGKNTVSVLIMAERKPLWLLAHEFGHIKYQVPNFSKYVEFYKRYYIRKRNSSNFYGHNDRDEGGKIAMLFGQAYQRDYKIFRKKLKDNYRHQIALIK